MLSLNVDALQVRTDDWERPARVLQALHLTQVRYPGVYTLLVAPCPKDRARRVSSCKEILFHKLLGCPNVVHRVGEGQTVRVGLSAICDLLAFIVGAALLVTQVPAHGYSTSALDYLRRRSVLHGAATDYDAAVALHERHPCFSRSCVGHLLPEGMLLLLENRYTKLFLVSPTPWPHSISFTRAQGVPMRKLGFGRGSWAPGWGLIA